MSRKFQYIWLVSILTAVNYFSQVKSLDDDWDYSVNNKFFLKNYVQLNNPAFLFDDYKTDFLSSSLGLDNESGSFKRAFDPERQNIYSAVFNEIKKLDSTKVFFGSAAYYIEDRKNVDKSIKYSPYDGEAFFLLDEGKGNIEYNGPSLSVAYSQKILDKTILGVQVNYEILRGLKNNYSNVASLLRNVSFNFGITQQVNSNLQLGLNSEYFNLQESYEGKSNDLTQTEFYNFRGDKYFVKSVGSTLKEKLKKNFTSVNPQIIYNYKNGEFILSGGYKHLNTKGFLPKEQLLEFEEGYASTGKWNLSLTLFNRFDGNYSLLLNSNYNKNNSWSKNSEKNLLLWKWNTEFLNVNAKLFSNIIKDVLTISVGYKYHSSDFDSTKYIDNKSITSNSINHSLNFGFLFSPGSRCKLISEINYRLKHDDIIDLENDLVEPFLKSILRYSVNSFEVDLVVNYNILKADNSELKREKLNVGLDLKLSEF